MLDFNDNGTVSDSICVSSFGKGIAVIYGTSGNTITLKNTSFIKISYQV